MCNVTKSLKEAVADSTWVQSATATRNGMRLFLCSGQLVYMGTVNNSNKTLCVDMCSVQQVRKMCLKALDALNSGRVGGGEASSTKK